MKQHANSYQGMNKDTAYDSIAPTFYIDALNVRITTTNGESLGGFTNIKGNKFAFSIPTSGTFNGSTWLAVNPEVNGYATIRTKIILFVADDFGEKGWIYAVEYNPANASITSGPTLIYYHPELNFKKEWPIEALGRFESDCIQRIYWTDYNNFFRSLNVEDTNLPNVPPGLIDVFPDIKFQQPLLKLVAGGGSLVGGTYQIAYKLITNDGKETLISPPSNIIHVVSDAETNASSRTYNGDPTPVNTGKALTIILNTSDYNDFNKIEFLSIYKSSATAAPIVSSIEQRTLDDTPTITFTYTGTESSIYDVELFDFITKNYQFKTAKTITQKDSSLVIANIKESQVSLKDLLAPGETFEAKTRRYKTVFGGYEPPFVPGTPDNDLKNAFNTAYNSDAHWNNTWFTSSQYKYKTDGRLGGEGPNISYTFYLEPFLLDATPPGTTGVTRGLTQVSNTPDFLHNLNDGYGPYANTTYANHASPFISGLLRGYKRGETYRFGIVFYTKKGEATFVEYIGDIKFPDISEADSEINNSGRKYWPLITSPSPNGHTTGYAMGIKFNIDFSTCPSLLNEIESYQIVRVKRELEDSRRISQGIIKTYYYNPIASPPSGTDFDLRVDGNSNVLHLYPYYPEADGSGGYTLYRNGSFYVYSVGGAALFEDYVRLGQYLNFYSPEISYKKDEVVAAITNGGVNPCLLVTGAFSNSANASTQYFNDFNTIDLGANCWDHRYQYKSVLPVSRSNGNIRKWQLNQKMDMNDASEYTQKVTPLFGSYYMRNYWCMDDYLDAPNVNPNKPQDGGNNDVPEIYKSGSSVTGLIGKILNDFFTGNPISSPPPYESFGNIAPLDPFTLLPIFSNVQDYFPIVEATLPKEEIYGGYTLNSLESNKFIPASPIIDVAYTQPNVFGGDIFLNMAVISTGLMDFNKKFYQGNDLYRQNNATTEVFPVESTINLDLAHGANLRTGVKYEKDGLREIILRQETDNAEAPYAKVLDMYAYNFVYSTEKDDVGFFVQPQNLVNCGANDIRAYLSNVKINEEVIDSWTKFGANNFYDIDDYGPINRILNWKDTVFFFQDKGVGAYAINRAAITTSVDGVPTQLGTGLGFGKHIYHSKVHGCIHQWAVDATEMGIYFFDAFHRKIFLLTSGGEASSNLNLPISEVKGMHSWLQALPDGVFIRKEDGGDNPIIGQGVTITKDVINDEILFTFLSKGKVRTFANSTTYLPGALLLVGSQNSQYYYVLTQFTTTNNPVANAELLALNARLATTKEIFNSDTLVYDELAQQFSSRYSMTPSIWINNGNILMSSDILNPRKIYTSNIGEWGVFYDVSETTELTLVINPDGDINKILRTLEYNSIVRDNTKAVVRQETITGFRIYNQVQDTGFVPFSPARFKRKFDKWRIKVPRDINSSSQQGRLRSTYFIITLYFENTDDRQLIMNKLMSYYDYQIF